MQTSKPHLGYWKIRGLAQQIRYVHQYLNVDYVDDMYETGDAPDFSRQGWMDVKHTMGFDFPNLPYYIDGDFKITESGAIIKYVCAKHKPEMLGTSVEETAKVEMLNGVIGDLKSAVTRHCYATGDKAEIKKAADNQLAPIAKFLGSKSFLVGEHVTYVDFIFFELLQLIDFALDGTYVSEHEALAHYVARMKGLHGVHVPTDLTFNNKMAKIGGAGSI